jgi:hypothetical protein
MIMRSKVVCIGAITFPRFTGERVYQLPFRKGQPLPVGMSRWQGTVDGMVRGVDTDEEMYLMVDQGMVEAGNTHRRPGPHIDGNWEVTGYSTGHRVMAWDTGGGSWNTRNLSRGGIILASDCLGAKVYKGDVDGLVGEGGDCSHLDLSNTETCVLEPNKAYLGNVTMIHESVEARSNLNRTLVRVTLPSSYAA